MSLPRPRWAEMDAEADWWGDAADVIAELVAGVDPDVIAGVCVSGLGPCLLVADADDRPLRAGILYGIDMRATEEIAELTARYGEEAIRTRCGKELSTQAVGPKLLWVRRREPDVWARARRWYSSHSFVVARLTGEYVLDHHTASQNDPLYDLRRQRLGRRLGRRDRPRPRAPAARVAGRGRRRGDRAGGRADGPAAGDAGLRGHRRRLGRELLRRRPRRATTSC